MDKGHAPLWPLSVFNWERPGIFMAALKAYYDGSGKAVDHFVTLAGFVATPEYWESFEQSWATVLRDLDAPRNKTGEPWLHMAEFDLLGEDDGWTNKRKREFLAAIHNTCFAPNWERWRNQVIAVSCTINMDDYRRALSLLPRLKTKEPEAICVDYCVTAALRMLPENPESQTGKSGAIELFFDQNETFLHKINRVFERSRRKPPFFHISSIRPANSQNVYELQAADYLAWHVNRFYTKQDVAAKMKRVFASPGFMDYIVYEKLVKKYGPRRKGC